MAIKMPPKKLVLGMFRGSKFFLVSLQPFLSVINL